MTASTTIKPRLSQQLSDELEQVLEELAGEAGCSKSDLLRKALREMEIAHDKKVKK
jgi:predicted transcriptional regulator